jgi:hypothetical protein
LPKNPINGGNPPMEENDNIKKIGIIAKFKTFILEKSETYSNF